MSDTGQRLNHLNQVKLYAGVIIDLDLKEGDLIIFVKNEQGRWEIRPAAEIAEELKAVWEQHD